MKLDTQIYCDHSQEVEVPSALFSCYMHICWQGRFLKLELTSFQGFLIVNTRASRNYESLFRYDYGYYSISSCDSY